MIHDDPSAERCCRTCGRDLPLTAFATAMRNRQNRAWICKECSNAYQRAHYRKLYPQVKRVRRYSAISATDWEQIIARGRMVCRSCGRDLSLDAFSRQHRQETQVRYRRDCKECINAAASQDPARRGAANLNARRHRLRQLGWSLDQFQDQLRRQESLCAICGMPLPEMGVVVEHDHRSGKVRGLVHPACNLTIGYAHEDIRVLLGAADFLVRHHPQKVWDLLRSTFILDHKENSPCPASA